MSASRSDGDGSAGAGDLVARARAFAASVHAGDLRKGTGESYFDGHLEPVAQLVAGAGGDEVQIAAAYLHDAAEDHGGERMLADIQDAFGDDVARIVADLSDSLVDDAGHKAPWGPRKRRYLEALSSKPRRSLEVAAADKLHNAESLLADHRRDGDAIWHRFNETDPARQLWYYTSLATILGERLPDHPTVVRLGGVVDALVESVGVTPAAP